MHFNYIMSSDGFDDLDTSDGDLRDYDDDDDLDEKAQFSRACLAIAQLRAYTRLEQVGRGVYACVYGGIISSPASMMIEAVKVIRTRHFRQVNYWDKNVMPLHAVREVYALRSIVHPNVIALRDVYVSPHIVALVLPAYQCSLRQVLKRTHADAAIAPAHTVHIMISMLNGLRAVHSAGFLHRDMKPENILLRDGGNEVVLADFGLSRDVQHVASEVLTGDVVTLWYAPPEVLCHLPGYTSKIDVYSCGVMLLELCCQGKLQLPILQYRNNFMHVILNMWGGAAALPAADQAYIHHAQQHFRATEEGKKTADIAPPAFVPTIVDMFRAHCGYDSDVGGALLTLILAMMQPVPDRRCTVEDALLALNALITKLPTRAALASVDFKRTADAEAFVLTEPALKSLISAKDVTLLAGASLPGPRVDVTTLAPTCWPPQFIRYVPRLYLQMVRQDSFSWTTLHALRLLSWQLPVHMDHDPLSTLFAAYCLLHAAVGSSIYKVMYLASATARTTFRVFNPQQLCDIQLDILSRLPIAAFSKGSLFSPAPVYMPRLLRSEADVQCCVVLNAFEEAARYVGTTSPRDAVLQRALITLVRSLHEKRVSAK